MANLRLIKNDDSLMTQFEIFLKNEVVDSKTLKRDETLDILDGIDELMLELTKVDPNTQHSTDLLNRVAALYCCLDRRYIRELLGLKALRGVKKAS